LLRVKRAPGNFRAPCR